MALINCPECQREISDKVKACPHCGYPLIEEAAPTVPTPSPEPTKKKAGSIKGYLFVAVAVLALLAGVAFFLSSSAKAKAREEYITDLKSVHLAMLSSGAEAENLGNLTRSVWYNTIFKKNDSSTDQYTKNTLGNFHSDFNDALIALWSNDSTKEQVSKIKSDRDGIEQGMKRLQNPPEGLETCYNTVTDMYEAYTELVNLITSPSGSLQSFTDSFRSADDALITQYNKLKTQIPEE